MTPERIARMTRKERGYWMKMLSEQLKKENEAIQASMPKVGKKKTSFGSRARRR